MMKSVLAPGSQLYEASLDEKKVPDKHGLYEIHIGEPKCLPSPFDDILSERNQTLLYIGKAEAQKGKKGIRQRLLDQDLRGKSNASFFRSIGVVLGYIENVKPLKRGNNFKFKSSDEIVDWIKQHLWVGWQLIRDEKIIEENEIRMIKNHRPILNLMHNPITTVIIVTLKTFDASVEILLIKDMSV